MRGMTPREPFDHLRHAALDLLESGNSTASVSQLLFIADYVHIDQAVIQRLDLVKTANQGVRPLTPMHSIPKAPT